MKKLVLLLAASAAFSTPAFAQPTADKQVLACIEQDNTGFHPNPNSSYKRTGFQVKRFTMVLSGKQLTVKVNNVEEVYQCSQPWGHKPSLIQCVERFYFMVLDTNRLRFIRTEMLGDLGSPIAGDGDSISVSYGECQKF
jgi:hypothetical protein